MEVTYKLFGVLKIQAGSPVGILELPDNATVEALQTAIETNDSGVSFQAVAVNIAVNQNLVSPQHQLGNGDEVAFIPPIAGG